MPVIRKIIVLSGIAALLGACSNTGINSAWMEEYQAKLASKKISQVVIPGSHFSNAYYLQDNKNPIVCIGETRDDSLSTNAKIAKLIQNYPDVNQQDFTDYLNTQDTNITGQLNAGSRYLELQLCQQDTMYYSSNYYLTDNFDSIIKQIKNFIADNTQEIIFIDFDNNLRAEYGLMSDNDINNFHNYLQMNFGSYLTPKQDWQNLTFSKLWDSKHRIILLSSNPTFSRYYDVLNKSEVVKSDGVPYYTTIKKLTAIQQQLANNGESSIKNQLMITPTYTWFDPARNSFTQLESFNNDHLIFDYLYSLPVNNALNIIVGDRSYSSNVVDYAIQTNAKR